MIQTNTSTFFAVRPALVLMAAHHFGIRAAILDGGARSLYNKAVALNSGKAPGRWGKHQQAVIKQFCEYTVTAGSDLLLPWQELVEDPLNYDGREGISARTGNRPLATVQRVAINIAALKQARAQQQMDLPELSRQSGLPQPLLQAIEDGAWPDIASSTAENIASVFGLEPKSLFVYSEIEEDDVNTGKAETCRQKITPIEKLKSSHLGLAAGGLSALLVLCSVLLILNWRTKPPLVEDFSSSLWRMSVELVNGNIPIPKETIQLWQNGGYIQLRAQGVVAFNWIDPVALVELPYPQVSWDVNDRKLTIKLDKIIYPFVIDENPETLVTLDSTRSFEMTLHAISR